MEVLICATRMNMVKVGEDGTSEIVFYGRNDDVQIVEEAKRFLKDHLKLLPKLTNNGVGVVSWPLKTLKYLGSAYKPMDLSQRISELKFTSYSGFIFRSELVAIARSC